MKCLVKRFSKIIICAVIAATMIIPMNAFAANPSFGISASTSSVDPNGSFKVSVGGECIGSVNISVSNGSASESRIWVENGYASVTITAGSSGSVTVTATPDPGMSDIDANLYEPGARSTTVKIKEPKVEQPSNNSGSSNTGGNGGTTSTPVEDNRDSNNKLSSLQVSPGTLAPAFNAGTTSYTVTVPSDTTEVVISATAASDKAKVSVSGGKDLKLGENAAKVVVTAENGSSKAYNLTIVCGEVEKIDINGTTNTINEGFSDEQIPAGFTRTKVTYNERQYEAVASESGMQLMYLSNTEGSAFYIYDSATQTFAPFMQITIADGKYIIPVPLDAADAQFAGYEQTTLTLNGQSVTAWKLDEEFSVIKVVNQNGEELYYKYDSVDGTYQRYAEVKEPEGVTIEGSLDDIVEPEPFYEKYSDYITLGAGAVAILFIILTIVLGVKLRRAKASDEDAFEDMEEDSTIEKREGTSEQSEEIVKKDDDDWDV